MACVKLSFEDIDRIWIVCRLVLPKNLQRCRRTMDRLSLQITINKSMDLNTSNLFNCHYSVYMLLPSAVELWKVCWDSVVHACTCSKRMVNKMGNTYCYMQAMYQYLHANIYCILRSNSRILGNHIDRWVRVTHGVVLTQESRMCDVSKEKHRSSGLSRQFSGLFH